MISLVGHLEYTSDEDELLEFNEDDPEDYEYNFEDDAASSIPKNEISFEKMQKVVKYVEENPKHKFKTLQSKFSFLTSYMQLHRFKKYVADEGTRRQKLTLINEKVFDQFDLSRNLFYPVRDTDIQRWGRKAAKEQKLDNFAASSHWLKNFKIAHKIVSGKVTKTITAAKKSKFDSNIIEEFRHETLTELLSYHDKDVFNTDQVGIVQEIRRMRTLSRKSERDTLILVQRSNAVTHSVTIQPTINLSGECVGKLLINLKEANDTFGKIVEKEVQKLEELFPFVKITCSKSGKLSKPLVGKWIEECLVPALSKRPSKNSILLQDSWAAQWNDDVWKKNLPRQLKLQKRKIPEGTTGKVQPLDVGYNSYFKYVLKRLIDFIIIEDLDCIVSQRYNLVSLISLTYNQMCAPVFKNMIRFSWVKSGLAEDRNLCFDAPKDICFGGSNFCDSNECAEYKMIRCAWCRKCLCFNHYYIEKHIH